MIFGRTGSGKTCLARSGLLPGRSRVLIVDPFGNYGGQAVTVASTEELVEYLRRAPGRWRIVYNSDRIDDDFPALCAVAWNLGDLLFVVDEADWHCSPAQIPWPYARLVKYGRNRRVEVCSIARRPSEVNRLLTSQAAMVFCGGMDEPTDVDYLRKYASGEIAERIEAGLPDLVLVQRDQRSRAMRIWQLDPAAGSIEQVEGIEPAASNTPP